MNSPLVTIAVAVYNTEKYLRDCMDSVVKQTYQNLEIICVNDCSTDKSLEILEEYAVKDTRIKIITNEKNSGLGVTRNVGMDAAHGEYILFTDSDDWLDLMACEKLVTKAKENDSDVVFYSAYKVNGDQKEKMKNFCDVSYLLSEEDRKILIKKAITTTWSKLWKLDFMMEKGIRFPDFRWAEDVKPHWLACLLAEKIAFESEYLYYYRTNETQSSQSGGKQFVQIIDAYNDIEKYLKEEKIYSLYKKIFLKNKFRHYDYAFFNIKVQFREEFIKKVKISFSDKFFLLTQHTPLKRRVFLAFLKSPLIIVLDDLRRGLYRKYKNLFKIVLKIK